MRKKNPSYRFLTDGTGAAKGASFGKSVLLRSFGNISAYEFSFPFQGMTKIREALKIRFKSLLGDGALHVSLIPFLTKIEKKSAAGCVFVIRNDEKTDEKAAVSDVAANCAVWPKPVVFACEAAPDGLLVCSGENGVTSVWFKNWTPVFYRVSPPGSATPEEEKQSVLEYIERLGEHVDKVLLVDLKDYSDEDLRSLGTLTISACPMYERLDLSETGASRQETREKIISRLAVAGRAALAVGLICLALMAGVYFKQSLVAGDILNHAGDIYEMSFGERSAQPLTSARRKLADAGKSSPGYSLLSFVSDISNAWKKLGNEPGLTIETLKYGPDASDILGTAKNNESIQRFRSFIEETGYSPRTDNIQTVLGGDLRFSMNIRRDAE
ncbi:MAG: hypothetical protein LBG12_02390 [Synergistaceae bacterium]|jgi:hypothetical protein|nr:hypothetical protein [Synergistaceae bacterium]